MRSAEVAPVDFWDEATNFHSWLFFLIWNDEAILSEDSRRESMTADTTATSEQRNNRHSNGASAATISRPIATTGEIFADGSLIELISDKNGNPQLMLWDGVKETVGPIVDKQFSLLLGMYERPGNHRGIEQRSGGQHV
jgi:hypothetical protein